MQFFRLLFFSEVISLKKLVKDKSKKGHKTPDRLKAVKKGGMKINYPIEAGGEIK